MKKYLIVYSDDANNDLNDLFDTITYDYKAPLTAFRYLEGARKTINSLSASPEIYPVQYNHSLQKDGRFVRRIDYKKMAILYTVHEDVVYVRRIIAASMILEV